VTELYDYNFSNKSNKLKDIYSDNELAYYLAGLLEGDGNINIPADGVSTLNRIFNPRITFTSHKNNLFLYKYLKSRLNEKGRFLLDKEGNKLRYIIGDIEGLKLIIRLLHNKLRTPKNITFNKLIFFMNKKYDLNFEESILDSSNIEDNSWLTGFIESDGHFAIRIKEGLPKSDTRKRSSSFSIGLKFILSQRSYDRATSSSMSPIMEKLAKYLSCNLQRYKKNPNLNLKLDPIDSLVIEIGSLEKIEVLIHYLNKFPLIGIKVLDFNDWYSAYNLIKNKKHLTDSGRETIKILKSKMNSKRNVNDDLD
jgi:LAGLIDADG endonuclease